MKAPETRHQREYKDEYYSLVPKEAYNYLSSTSYRKYRKNTEKEYWIRYQKTQLLVSAKFINHVIFVESLILFLFYLTEFLLRPNAIISRQGTGGNELI